MQEKGCSCGRGKRLFLAALFRVRARRGDSERGLNELQRRVRAAAISTDPTATGAQREKRRDSRTEARRPAALTSPRGLSAQPPGRAGLGAEPRASVLAGRESGKKAAAAEEARDFFLPLCFLVREERGFRAPPKQTPETGTSRGCQRGPQRRAGDAKAAAAATKKPVCEPRSLSTPPLPGAGAACHHQAPVIRGKLPRENARRASGCCNVTTPLTPQARPASSVPLPPPGLSEPEPPKQLLL